MKTTNKSTSESTPTPTPTPTPTSAPTSAKKASPFVANVTPEESKAFFSDLKPDFQKSTIAWIIGAKTGPSVFAARVADVRVIATVLFAKQDALPLTKEGAVDKEALKSFRERFNKLTDALKTHWDGKAQFHFKAALNDYHAATKPLKKEVYGSKVFSLKSLRITLAKSGNVSVTSRHLATADSIAK